jgi:hypothetical protein
MMRMICDMLLLQLDGTGGDVVMICDMLLLQLDGTGGDVVIINFAF